MEDSRFAEASRRVYPLFNCLEGKGGRVDGRTEAQMSKSGSEFRQMDTGTFLVIKKHAFLWVTCWGANISREAGKCGAPPF